METLCDMDQDWIYPVNNRELLKYFEQQCIGYKQSIYLTER